MPRFDCATWRPIGANTGGRLSPNLGLILHHAVMDGSLFAFFGKPASQVSAHFWVSQGGAIEQYVDTDVVAWHARQLNGRYVGVETEGCTQAPYADPMSEAMIDALARLYAEGARRHGWANALIGTDGGRGFGFHRMAVATGCPCDVRLNRRAEILRRAFGGTTQPPAPPPTGVPELRVDWFGLGHNDRCADVRVYQDRMKARGWRIGVDGIFGPESDRVTRQFQTEKNLGTDGKVGPVTWRAAWQAPVT